MVCKLPVAYICHKHRFLGGLSKTTCFSPEFALVKLSSPPLGTARAGAERRRSRPPLHGGWWLPQARCFCRCSATPASPFLHPAGEKNPLQPNFSMVSAPESLALEVLRRRDVNYWSSVPKLRQHESPAAGDRQLSLWTQSTSLLGTTSTRNALFPLSHTLIHTYLLLLERKGFI